MKERPILFSAPMVRALLAGTKTQTRRIVKPGNFGGACLPARQPTPDWNSASYGPGIWSDDRGFSSLCPYGQPGDRLWVREAFQRDPLKDGEFLYRATQRVETVYDIWKPSIHMPKVASRITLEITNVRVERLKDISHKDAKAEGVDQVEDAPLRNERLSVAQHIYAHLWESINGPGSWEANPWVWVVEFKRVTA